MSTGMDKPTLAFVWRLRDMSSAVIDVSRRTNTRPILDLSSEDFDAAAMAVIRADAVESTLDVKVSPEQLASKSFEDFLNETGIKGIWIDLNPHIPGNSLLQCLERLVSLPSDIRCHVVTGDLEVIEHVLVNHGRIQFLAIKGSESAGFVSTENILPLYTATKSLAAKGTGETGLMVWGGIATARAAAALLSVGLNGIVFESLHWQSDLVNLDADVRDKLSKIRPEHSEVIGLNLGIPYRAFNKGNSLAVKNLREYVGSLCGSEIGPDEQGIFVQKIVQESVPPLDSTFSRNELIPLGIEAAFAQSFVNRYGVETEEAIRGFQGAIDSCLAGAPEKVNAFTQGEILSHLGTRYAFIQGAMSWITDVPEFALSVAEAGALPTIALGLLPASELDKKLGSIRDLLDDKPLAVNVITLQENPFRDQQLKWIRDLKPRFAVIAAGEPSHARELLEVGVEVIYIAPNLKLLELAFSAGIRFVICEGNEAGGHVGEHSTFTLAQMIEERRLDDPAFFEGRFLVLAGGVCNRESAFIAAMLGADAIQVGTSYLATAEIVQTGALSSLYQKMILDSKPGGTVVTGEATGLRVRSLRTAKIEAVCSLERDFAAGSTDEATFRRQIEEASAGSLLVAARMYDRMTGKLLDENACVQEGQFMSGACAGVLDRIRGCADLHTELAQSPLPVGLPFVGPITELNVSHSDEDSFAEKSGSGLAITSTVAGRWMPSKERIAITGMSIVNSLGNSPEEVWAACSALRSGIIEVPASKWPHEMFFDPRPRAPEKTYCRVGAFQSIEVERKELGIPPQDFRTMTASTRITMWLANQAILDSGILDSDIPRSRIAVLISQNSGEAAATLEDMIVRSAAVRIVDGLKGAIDLNDESAQLAEEAIKEGRLAVDDTTLLGRLNCAAGGFICNKYGFMGPSFAVSAACATALVALFSAYQMIRNGIIDAAVIGGAEEPLTPMHFLEFSALGALAGLSGQERKPVEMSRPFDANRDGMVLGEGGGIIVIERESVARQRGARIHGYITAMGASNNHLGMVESSRQTQEIAIGACFDDAGYGPETVDLIECHATSTMQGDGEEVLALRNFFSPETPVVLTSFKSQIGHTLGASGVNSLIRGVMAMKQGLYPPTLNYRDPDPAMQLEGSGMSIFTEPAQWERRDGKPRRLQVNAFGFGGSNYVVHVEEALEDADYLFAGVSDAGHSWAKPASNLPLPQGVQFFVTELRGEKYRVAVVAPTKEEARKIIAGLDPVSGPQPLSDKTMRALAKQGVSIWPISRKKTPLAFIFPGQGSHYAGMGRELYETFPEVKEWMDRIATVAEFDILKLMFYDTEADLQKTRWQQPALYTLELSIVKYLMAMGVEPCALAGHSLGELTALCLSGVYSFEDGFRIVNKRAICMDKACEMNIDPGVMMAVDAPLDYLKEILAKKENIYITNINSPRQVVLGGNSEAVKELGEELKAQGYRRTLLRVSMAFHSPIMRCIHDELDAFVSQIQFHPPKIPVVSNTTMRPFPSDSTEIRSIIMAHLESPVHWMQNATALWDDFGVRTFVEVGPRDILTNLVSDTLSKADCIYTAQPGSETSVFRGAVAQLYVRGHIPVEGDLVPFPGEIPRVTHRVGVRPSALPVRTINLPVPAAVSQPIHQHIQTFVSDGFGKFVKPALLYSIRKDFDPGFSESDLEQALLALYPGLGVGEPLAALPISQASQKQLAETAKPIQKPHENMLPASEVDELTETVIRLIMDATGYERSEIEPGMDLRDDLSIRSSRLPVIMDSMENQFGIKIHLEDFMEVRTIADIVEKLRELIDPSSLPAAVPRKERVEEVAEEALGSVEVAEEKAEPIRRFVFRARGLEPTAGSPISLTGGQTVLIVAAHKQDALASRIADVFQEKFGVKTKVIDDIFPQEGAFSKQGKAGSIRKRLDEAVASADRLAGVVIVLSREVKNAVADPASASRILTEFFSLMKLFVDSPDKKFAFCIYEEEPTVDVVRLLAQGTLGMFLSLGHEFSSIQFRTIGIGSGGDLGAAIEQGLNRNQKVIETFYRQQGLSTSVGIPEPLHVTEAPAFVLRGEDVVVLSGGARGITYHLARKLADFGCKLAFLGTTPIDPDVDYKRLLHEGNLTPERLSEEIRRAKAGISQESLEKEQAVLSKALEIVSNVEALRASGAEASYYRCDVTDLEQTNRVIKEILIRYEGIQGVVHGAGILKDNFARQMTVEDFKLVTDVKFLGGWNLLKATESKGLRFFVCLSSGAAIQGNPGQANYSTGNRMMSALADSVRSKPSGIMFKALQLPPIEGSGMAENEEIRALMKRMNASYVHVEELAELFIRELAFGPIEEPWVLFMRSLPHLESSLLEMSQAPVQASGLMVGPARFDAINSPMIDEVTRVDLKTGELEAVRTFSISGDPWIVDHKPFKFLKKPLVSAIMVVETFLEAAHLLYPHMKIQSLSDAQFLDILDCTPDADRQAHVSVRRISADLGHIVGEVSVSARDTGGREGRLGELTLRYKALVTMSAVDPPRDMNMDGFPVEDKDIETRPMLNEEVLKLYAERSDMQGRYRLIKEMDGTGPDCVRGRFVYPDEDDFAPPRKSLYRYSPYLLEALMQASMFFIGMRDEEDRRVMIPHRIGEIVFSRQCKPGETITIEGRVRQIDREGVLWEARGLDEQGTPLMCLRKMKLRWFS